MSAIFIVNNKGLNLKKTNDYSDKYLNQNKIDCNKYLKEPAQNLY